jgi:hypothetical protein
VTCVAHVSRVNQPAPTTPFLQHAVRWTTAHALASASLSVAQAISRGKPRFRAVALCTSCEHRASGRPRLSKFRRFLSNSCFDRVVNTCTSVPPRTLLVIARLYRQKAAPLFQQVLTSLFC